MGPGSHWLPATWIGNPRTPISLYDPAAGPINLVPAAIRWVINLAMRALGKILRSHRPKTNGGFEHFCHAQFYQWHYHYVAILSGNDQHMGVSRTLRPRRDR